MVELGGIDFLKDDIEGFFADIDPMMAGNDRVYSDNRPKTRNHTDNTNTFELRQQDSSGICNNVAHDIQNTNVGEPYGSRPVEQSPYTKHNPTILPQRVHVGSGLPTYNRMQSTSHDTIENQWRHGNHSDANAVYFPEYQYRTDQSFVNVYEKNQNYPVDPAFWWLEQTPNTIQGVPKLNKSHVALKTLAVVLMMYMVLFYYGKKPKEMVGSLLIATTVGLALALSPSCGGDE